MIVQLRGTSGSGKSTAMRRVMDSLGTWNGVHVPGRRQPLYYFLDGSPRIVVLGHYETPCGGCDTIGSAGAVHRVVRDVFAAVPEAVVLTEGLLLSEDVKWTTEMNRLAPVRAVFLVTPVEKCIEQIKARRAAGGNEKPLKEDNTRNRVGTIDRARGKLEAAGVYVRRASADQSVRLVLNWVRLHANPGGGNGPGTELDQHSNGGRRRQHGGDQLRVLHAAGAAGEPGADPGG